MRPPRSPEASPARERVYAALQGGPATRPELAGRTGLSVPTVITAVDDLIVAGLATLEGTGLPGSRGRPAARVRLTPERFTVTALDLGGPELTTGRYDLGGTRQDCAGHGPPMTWLGPEPLENVARLLGLLRARGPADVSVVSVLGAVHPRTRTLTSLPLALRDFPLEAELSAALGWPVLVENDANLSAWAAWRHLGLDVGEPLVFLNYSHGIGVGLVLGGQVYHGASGAAGEVSFAADPRGRGERGRPVPLALRLLGHLQGVLPGEGVAPVAALAATGDRAARQALGAFTRDLAHHLTAVAAVLDPAVLVLQDVPHAAGPLCQEVRQAMTALGLGPQVQVSPLGPLGGLDSAGGYGALWLERRLLAGLGEPVLGESVPGGST